MEVSLQPDLRDITFRLALCEEDKRIVVRMSYCLEGDTFMDTGYTFTPSDHTWVGAKLGLFAVALDNSQDHGYADFEYMKVTAL
jgi:hypothetical protein